MPWQALECAFARVVIPPLPHTRAHRTAQYQFDTEYAFMEIRWTLTELEATKDEKGAAFAEDTPPLCAFA